MLLSLTDISKKYNVHRESARARIRRANLLPVDVKGKGVHTENLYDETNVDVIMSIPIRITRPKKVVVKTNSKFATELCVKFIRGYL